MSDIIDTSATVRTTYVPIGYSFDGPVTLIALAVVYSMIVVAIHDCVLKCPLIIVDAILRIRVSIP